MNQIDIYIDQLDVPMPGMAALEAMAMGKVVITGNMEVGKKFFPDYENCPVFHGSSDGNSLIETLRHIFYLRDKWNEIGLAGRDFVEKHHNHIQIAERFLKVWKSL